MKVSFFKNYPREVLCSGRKILVNNEEEVKKLLKAKINISNFYLTVYSYQETTITENNRAAPAYETAVVNKMYFDIDRDNCWDNLQKLNKWCEERKLIRCVVFSGRGYHFYISCKITTGRTVKNFQKYLIKKIKLGIDDKHLSFLCDVARVLRYPNTRHFNKNNLSENRWCVGLLPEEIKLSYVEHIKIASKPRNFTFKLFGKKLLDINNFDDGIVNGNFDDIPKIDIPEGDLNIIKKLDFNSFKPCIKEIINSKKDKYNKKNGYVVRRVLINYAKEELGLTMLQCVAFMKKILNIKEYNHMLKEVKGYKYGQVEYLYNKGRIFMPNCETLYEWNLCPENNCNR